jgi:hypothetical protein
LRKIASIILLVVLLFNMVGYRAWFYYAEMKSDAAMEASMDKDQYDQDNIVSINIALDNPYQIEQKSFERVNGELSFQGKTYKYFRRRVSNGNLTIQCLPDQNKMVLKKARAEYASNANDLTGSSKNSSRSDFQKNFVSNDYIADNYVVQLTTCTNLLIISGNRLNAAGLSEIYIASPGKPPRFIA